MNKKCVRELSSVELAAWLHEQGQPQFRTSQIRDWLYAKLAVSFDEMANLPKQLRELLKENFAACSVKPVDIQRADDHTVKWLSELSDGATVETVLIRSLKRNTVCISTQVGCAVRCAFCESGRHGFVRDLKSCEIVDQVVLASHEAGKLVDNIVVMGTGEPMHNLRNLIPALDEICDQEKGFGMGARHITVSTSGIPQGIRNLADLQRPWNLALSLHAVNDRQRAMIIPDKHRYPLNEVFDACAYYRERTGRMVTFEYVLVEGVNSSEDDARELARLAKRSHAKVNLIPCNQSTAKWRAPKLEDCKSFLNILESRGVQATIRLRKGDKIKAACGQLRAQKGQSEETGESNE